MTALGKLLRTTAFRLTLVYLALFALFAALLLFFLALNARRLITEEITATVNREVAGLNEQYERGGIGRLAAIIELRSRRPGSSLYLVATPLGQGLAGNVASLDAGILTQTGWVETSYQRLDQTEGNEHRALVLVSELPGGFHLLVGRDIEERQRVYDIIITAGRWSILAVVVLGLGGGFFVSRHILRRVDAITEKAQTISAGDLSGRLPVAGTGDEIDRLALNFNVMLDRIESLMRGFKEVSDNVAHDLKTPLTRLRNRCEAALRNARSDSDYRAALDATIEESEGLIRTFDALLMIARAESGEAGRNMVDLDAAEIVSGVAELYEPLAEEKGLHLVVDAPVPALVHGHRELISQALANLVDNAIKYAAPAPARAEAVLAIAGDVAPRAVAPSAVDTAATPTITMTARNDGDRVVLIVADSGPGIPIDARAHAVERFVRLEQSRSQPGSGLGLSLASAVAHLHHGELKLDDNEPGLKAMILLPRVGAQTSG
ncbi:MAG TPA: ATP-binding protein [Xanthobacteraceae bacterium]|nr:ATP-binding protein [Xanthobacteraceae bacterium]